MRRSVMMIATILGTLLGGLWFLLNMSPSGSAVLAAASPPPTLSDLAHKVDDLQKTIDRQTIELKSAQDTITTLQQAQTNDEKLARTTKGNITALASRVQILYARTGHIMSCFHNHRHSLNRDTPTGPVYVGNATFSQAAQGCKDLGDYDTPTSALR